MLSFRTPWERQKTLDFLLFPGGTKSELWEEMGEIISYVNIYKI